MQAEVLVELKAKNIDKTFSYNIPDNLKEEVKIGIRVTVPFGKQILEGFVLNIKKIENLNYKLKDIISVIDKEPILNEELLLLGKYISKKTVCNLISAYQTMLPSALKAKKGFEVPKKYITYIEIIGDTNNLKSAKQKEIIDYLKNHKNVTKKTLTNISSSALKSLINNNILKEVKKEEYRLDNNSIVENSNINLSIEQKNTIDKILKSKNIFKPFLVHGVTGSGKTEVYMHLISEVLKEKKEAIVLVPEISLTPQLVSNFKKRFGGSIAILHSNLSNGEKYDEWRKIERKEVSIVIGARSAIFAPFTNLGLIIIDEEHSSTYKQENNPKYHAIDIALWRAKKHNIPVVLGSATPSIESYTRASMGIYELCEMKNRVNNNLPLVTLVDMKNEIRKHNTILSQILKEKIEEKINKGEQVILLLNRRGYSTITMCKSCGYVDKCPNCDIPLIYHKSSNTVRCHYCGYGKSKLISCPECKSEDLNDLGMGTEKLEQYIKDTFPKSKVIRMDNDTTSTKGSHQKIIEAFSNLEYNILIGTQMVAKGLDFPKVTLVGVINGDSSLNIPDFRSAERTFQLLNQVAGRAGRSDLKGEVIIQGFNIDNYSIKKASIHDYIGFYTEEMKLRKLLKYSPFYNLCLIKIKAKDYNIGLEEGKKITGYLNSNKIKDISILGPSMASMPKINNIYQIQIIIKYKKTDILLKELNYINDLYRTNNKVTIDIDLNPIRI